MASSGGKHITAKRIAAYDFELLRIYSLTGFAITNIFVYMPREKSDQPTDVELAILRVLWSKGKATVREVHDALTETKDRGLSSTLKMMQVMLEKGLLVRDDDVRPQVYRPAQKQAKTQLGLLDSVALKAFDGSAMNMVASLVSNRRLSDDELAELKQLIEDAENANSEKG